MHKHNFTAGPSILPTAVLQEAAQGILNFNNSGLSILEVSHRGKYFVPVIEEAIALVKELMQLTNDYEVLFLHGGASTQFMQLPLNLLATNATAAYANTGVWSAKAIKEAAQYGKVHIASTSEDSGFNYIPKQFNLQGNEVYLHITTNNTIYGSQYHFTPNVSLPLVADMSSDIFSKKLDYTKYSAIYAGAQKNMGTSGVNLIVIKKDLLGKAYRHIPTMLDYAKHIDANSLLNTPPVFAIYLSLLTLRWIKEQTIEKIEANNNAKANLFYSSLDKLNPFFKGTIADEDRSKMNAVFVLNNPELDKTFATYCDEQGIEGIKGHRLAGGFRASMYNALPISSVQYLAELMAHFAQKHG
jgi:phosphoserine aminotransferase